MELMKLIRMKLALLSPTPCCTWLWRFKCSCFCNFDWPSAVNKTRKRPCGYSMYIYIYIMYDTCSVDSLDRSIRQTFYRLDMQWIDCPWNRGHRMSWVMHRYQRQGAMQLAIQRSSNDFWALLSGWLCTDVYSVHVLPKKRRNAQNSWGWDS